MKISIKTFFLCFLSFSSNLRKDNKKALSYGALKLAAQIYKSPMELEIIEENK